MLDKESGDNLSEVYERGFLPYSASVGVANRFYLARSARIPLSDFSLSSENRRVWKKFENMFSVVIAAPEIIAHDEAAIAFMLNYFKERHGEDVMSRERLIHILSAELGTTVSIYKDKNKATIAYVIENADSSIGHFWFSFYDLSFVFQSLGMWLMIERVLKAKEEGKTHYYLGTVYGEKALYKTNFNNLEYWNGVSWVSNIAELKSHARTDASRSVVL